MNKEMNMNSSTGGVITLTKTGLIHKASSGAYSGRVAEDGSELRVVDQVKRGRGRPKKVTSANGSYDFSAFGSVVIPKWNGASRFYFKNPE
jgi:hypothetical protein